MSIFGIKTTNNAFALNTAGNGSTSIFGNTNSSTPNPFAVNTTGNSSTSIFGIATNSTPSPFGVNTTRTASTSIFGGTNNPSPNPFAANTIGNTSTSIFGNVANSTPNPFGVNTTGSASTSIFGNTNNSIPNPFGVNTTGSASASIFGNTNNSTPNPFATNTNGNTSTSIFGNVANSTPNPFGGNTTGNTTVLSFNGTSTGGFGTSPLTSSGFTAGPTGSGSLGGFTTNNNAFSGGPLGTISSGPTFGQPSNNIFGNRGTASPFTTFGGSSTTFPGTSTSAPTARPFAFGTTDSDSNPFGTAHVNPSQNKGSKISPYKITKDTENDVQLQLHSISCMPIYASKSHEELRLEDSELNSKGPSSSLFPPQLPDFNAAQNPFRLSPTPSTNPTPIFSIPSFVNPFSNPTSSSTTTPVFNLQPPSNPFLSLTPSPNPTPISNHPSSPFPSLPPFNSTSSTTSSSVFNQPSPSFPVNNLFLNPTPSFNSTPSTTTSPVFNQPSPSFPNPTPSLNFTTSSPTTPSIFPLYSSQNPISTSIPPLTSAPSSPITWATLAGTNINPAPSAWVGLTLPVLAFLGNNGASTGKTGDCIIAVKDPFGSQSATCPPSIAPPVYSPVSRSGISSMPVIDKPTATRISSLVATRHISSRPLTVPVRKYQPKSDVPKVPFFDHTNETQNAQMKSTIIPRTNPRSMFVDNSKLSGLSIANDEVTDESVFLHEAGGAKAKNSTPHNKENEKPDNDKSNRVNPSVPKLNRSDYYTQPSIQDLTSFETSNSGFCSHVKDFVVGRHGYGSVKFKGETDVRGLDLDSLVFFDKSEIIVYKDENEKPEIGQGLNKQAEVTLLNVKYFDKSGKGYSSGKMVDKFVAKLKKVAENQGAEFVSYDAVDGVWKFQVKHFN